MNISKQGGCTWEDVAEFERSYNVEFPPDYREFLVKYNGGATPNSYCQISRKIVACVMTLYGIGDVRSSVQTEKFGEGTEFPEILERELFPIGEDLFGNLFLLRIRNAPGEVYFYAPEFCPFEEKPTFLLAPSFTAFLQKCWSGEFTRERALRPIEEREMLMKGLGKTKFSDQLRKDWQAEIDIFSGAAEEEIVLGQGKGKANMLRRLLPSGTSEIDKVADLFPVTETYKAWRRHLDESILADRIDGYEGHFDIPTQRMQMVQKSVHRTFLHVPFAEIR